MLMKNKLVKHHKSKASLFVRKFSIVFSSIMGLFAIIAIPTYINLKSMSDSKLDNNQKSLASEVVEDAKTSELETVNNI